MDLGGLGIREIRQNADDQSLIIAGTPDGSNSQFALCTWDGEPGDAPTLTNTALPQVEDGAWEGIVSVPDPLVDGSTVELVGDNGDTTWYDDTSRSKSGLPTGLQKDLGETFTISLPAQTVSFGSTPPAPGVVADTHPVSASASSGDPVALTIDASSASGTCTLSGITVTFTGPGRCVLDGNQAGGIDAAPAPQAQQTITVAAPPTVNISTPANGATYADGQVVDANFTCTDGTDGPGISACTDNQGVPAGGAVDTGAGTHTFTVTAVSLDGASTSVTYTAQKLVNSTPPSIRHPAGRSAAHGLPWLVVGVLHPADLHPALAALLRSFADGLHPDQGRDQQDLHGHRSRYRPLSLARRDRDRRVRR